MMNAKIHLSIATTFSMLLTYVFYCALVGTRAYNSLIQRFFIDLVRDPLLAVRCWFDGRHNFDLCGYLLIGPDLAKLKLLLIISCFFGVLLLCYDLKLFDRMKSMILTIFVGWLITRYCDSQNIYINIDVLTVYFIVWQFIYLMCKWEGLELEWPFLILQQASCCISMSIRTFLWHDVIFVYLPFQFKIIFLWLFSLYDIVVSLHPHGYIREIPVDSSSSSSPPGLYYTYDIESIHKYEENVKDDDFEDDTNGEEDLNKDNFDYGNSLFLGLGDFFVYNLMVLFILLPVWSMTTKILVVFGCIISIQIGLCGSLYIRELLGLGGVPALPLPVITFSIYAMIISVIMKNTNIGCQ